MDGKHVEGEWLQVKYLNQHTISSFSIQANCLNPGRAPAEVVLAGSNNWSEWTLLHSETNICEWIPRQACIFQVAQSCPLCYFCLIVHRNSGDCWVTTDKLLF